MKVDNSQRRFKVLFIAPFPPPIHGASMVSQMIKKTATKPEIFASMSDDARNYYLGKASPERMAQGVVNAIKYVTNCRFE